MPPPRIVVAAAVAAVAAVLLTVAVDAMVVGDGNAVTLTLERANHDGMELSHLLNRDRVRHARMLQQNLSGVIDFPLEGTWDPTIVGLYYTKIQLGTPPQEFHVQIDTGSDGLWVGCHGCEGCPTSSTLQIKPQFFNPSSSSTASIISCSDERCFASAQVSASGCRNDNRCGYQYKYGDGAVTTGYYVSDVINLNKSSTQVLFGCSTLQSGGLLKSDRATDGIIGLGQQSLSVITQLASKGVSPKAFSHCLKGDNGGGGILVLGKIQVPNMVYTPILQETYVYHYNLELQSISVNGQKLHVDPIVFATSTNRGTIIDSGTTLGYLVEEAFNPLLEAILKSIPKSVRPYVHKDNQCFYTSASISESFPTISFNFAGDAPMKARPKDYLMNQGFSGGDTLWCMSIQKSITGGITIIGDNFQKDKVVVFDLAAQKVGWADYDCSTPVNVSTADSPGKPGKTQTIWNAAQMNKNTSPERGLYKLIPNTMVAFFLYITFFAIRPFL